MREAVDACFDVILTVDQVEEARAVVLDRVVWSPERFGPGDLHVERVDVLAQLLEVGPFGATQVLLLRELPEKLDVASQELGLGGGHPFGGDLAVRVEVGIQQDLIHTLTFPLVPDPRN